MFTRSQVHAKVQIEEKAKTATEKIALERRLESLEAELKIVRGEKKDLEALAAKAKERPNAKGFPPAQSQKKAERPASRPTKRPVSLTDRIIQRLFSVTSTKYVDRGYAGFTFGTSYASLQSKLKAKVEGNREQVWLVTKDEVRLLFCKDKLVGVMKLYYKSAVRESSRALAERFGKVPPEQITEFASVLRPIGNNIYTGQQTLIRYCFSQCIVYGYISSGDRLLEPFMTVSAFDRGYLEDVFRREIEQKQKILEAARPVIVYAFGDSLKWDSIPFPKVKGTTSVSGLNILKEKVALLEGRSAPQGTEEMPARIALSVREHKQTPKAIAVTICFNSFPTFEMPPLTAARLQKEGLWVLSQGNWHVEHDAQKCNAMLAGEMFPSADGKIKTSTISNPVREDIGEVFAHKSYKVYSWETKEGYILDVLGNNTIAVVKRDKLRIE